MPDGTKIMIVDDSNTVRYEVRLILENAGYSVVDVANEIGMFIKIEEYGKLADLIIMDLILASENGLDLVKKLKETENYKDIPILMLTEHADVDSVIKAKHLGVAGYIKKPIDKDELLKRVDLILGGLDNPVVQ